MALIICCCFLQVATMQVVAPGRSVLDQCQFAMQCLVREFMDQAEAFCAELGQSVDKDKVLSLSLQQQRLAESITEEVISIRHNSWFWEQFAAKVVKPSFELALGSQSTFNVSADSLHVRLWREVVAALSQDLPVAAGSCLLAAQIHYVKQTLPDFWSKALDAFQLRQDRAAQKEQAEAMAALAAAASGSSRGRSFSYGASYNRPVTAAVPALTTLKSELAAVDAVWKDKRPEDRGCKFWSGIDGSCIKGAQCLDAALHVKGSASAWHAARGKVFAQQGGIQDRMGNWVLPSHISGAKRPMSDITASSAPSFQQSAT